VLLSVLFHGWFIVSSLLVTTRKVCELWPYELPLGLDQDHIVRHGFQKNGGLYPCWLKIFERQRAILMSFCRVELVELCRRISEVFLPLNDLKTMGRLID